MTDDTHVTPDDDSGLSRRALIKRAAIVGGVVAWTAPTIQVLGQGTAWAGSKKLPPGTVTICGTTKTKPGRVRYTWLGDTNAGGSCTDHSIGTCPSGKCACTDYPTQGTYSCGDGTVYITVTGGVIDQASVSPASGYDSPTQVHGTAGNLTFDMSVTNNSQTFTVSQTSGGDACQYSEFHVSCSATPPVQPGFQIGGMELFDWSLT